MGFQLCSPPTHTEILFENKLCQKDKSSLRIVQGLASCRDLFKPFPPNDEMNAEHLLFFSIHLTSNKPLKAHWTIIW